MQECSNCREDLVPEFDFCHHCGAAATGAAATAPARSKMVEMADELEEIASRSVALGSSATQTMNDWLGSPTSVQRRIAFALMTGLTLMLAYRLIPFSNPLQWLEYWLLLSVLVLPMISYWVTGFIPFSDLLNTVCGDILSLRRRLILTFIWSGSTSLPTLLITLFRPNAGEGAGVMLIVELSAAYVGNLLIMFYLMGHTTVWRPIWGLETSHFLDRMSRDADRVAEQICEKLREREIEGLEITEIEMAKLRHLTGGESSGRHGRQITFTSGRARIVIFVQDFGDSLLIRWGGYFDASGRRLWVLFGLLLSNLNNLLMRWTSINVSKAWGDFLNALKPLGRHQLNFTGVSQGGLLTRLFGMVEGISEYGWNEIYALNGAVSDTVGGVAGTAQTSSKKAHAIHGEVARQARIEGHRPPAGITRPGAFGPGGPR